MKRILLAFLLVLVSACSKDITAYQEDSRAYFYDLTATQYPQQVYSRTFSFATMDNTVTVDTQYIPVKIQGLASDHDRIFAAKALADSTTAIAGTDYRLLPGVIKANAFTGMLPLVLFRTAQLKTVTLRLYMSIADTADFKAGVDENNYYLVSWNDDLIKPNNWDTSPGLKLFFGDYSRVKYEFIISVLHKSSFDFLTGRTYDPTKITVDQMYDYAAQLKSALKTYNATHTPPLTDEYGIQVTFP